MQTKINAIRHNGFTLIELAIIIAIVVILALITTSNVISYRDKSVCAAAETDAREMAAAIANYFSTPTHYDAPDTNGEFVSSHLGVSMSNENRIRVAEETEDNKRIIRIQVKEASGRCPWSYREPHPGWCGTDEDNYIFTLEMTDN